MKSDPWRCCKIVSGRDSSKKGSWCAALHEASDGSLWCGTEITHNACPWRYNANISQIKNSAEPVDQRQALASSMGLCKRGSE